jgi:hypothetical protein
MSRFQWTITRATQHLAVALGFRPVLRLLYLKSDLSSGGHRGIQGFAGSGNTGGAGKDPDPSLRSG